MRGPGVDVRSYKYHRELTDGPSRVDSHYVLSAWEGVSHSRPTYRRQNDVKRAEAYCDPTAWRAIVWLYGDGMCVFGGGHESTPPGASIFLLRWLHDPTTEDLEED